MERILSKQVVLILAFTLRKRIIQTTQFRAIWKFLENNMKHDALLNFRDNPTSLNQQKLEDALYRQCLSSGLFMDRLKRLVDQPQSRAKTFSPPVDGQIKTKKITIQKKDEFGGKFRPVSGRAGSDNLERRHLGFKYQQTPARDAFGPPTSGAARAVKKKVALKKPTGGSFSGSTKRKAVKKVTKSKGRKIKDSKSVVLTRCFTRTTIDQQVTLKQKVPIEVKISLEEIADRINNKSSSGSASGIFDKTKKIAVCLRPVLNIKVVCEARKIVDGPGPDKDVMIDFFVQATHPGICKVAVDVWQEQVSVCSLELTTNCVKERSKFGKKHSSASSGPVIMYDEPFFQLKIFNRENGATWSHQYEIHDPKMGYTDEESTLPNRSSRQAYITKLYREIETLWTTTGGDAMQFQDELRNYGASLFLKLIPPRFQQYLYDNVHRISPIQLFSTETYIPWELLVIRNPDRKKKLSPNDKFLGELGLTRWLHGPTSTNDLLIRKTQARYIVPQYRDSAIQLPGSKEEILYLKKNFAAKPIAPDPLKIGACLKKPGSFDLLHFCCHGTADPRNIMASKLMLMERSKTGKPAYLTLTSVEHCGAINKGSVKPIVVLNACQSGRLGTTLTSYGGFASAFLHAGAGAFVGTLWSIEDASAVSFISALYEALRSGETLSKATVLARKMAAKNGDATWISYVIYGSPFARLRK